MTQFMMPQPKLNSIDHISKFIGRSFSRPSHTHITCTLLCTVGPLEALGPLSTQAWIRQQMSNILRR
jgi:hypothetical protein